jgi:predicted fused transcriptional regulator/phosphomethylpyrimidine kinase
MKIKAKIRVVLLSAQDYITPDDALVKEMTDALNKKIKDLADELFESMKEKGIDIFNVKREMELRRIEHDDNFLNEIKIEFEPNVIIDSLGTLKESFS